MRRGDHVVRSAIEDVVDRLSDTAGRVKPRINDLRVLPKVKALRAVNQTAIKAVDKLEDAGLITNRQANRARAGIVSADIQDTRVYTRDKRYGSENLSFNDYDPVRHDDTVALIPQRRNRGDFKSNTKYKSKIFSPPYRPESVESRMSRRNAPTAQNVVLAEDMTPKGRKELEMLGNTPLRGKKTFSSVPGMREYEINRMIGASDKASSRQQRLNSKFNDLYPYPPSDRRTAKNVAMAEARDDAIRAGLAPSSKFRNKVDSIESRTTDAYRDAYKDIRRLAGLGAGIGTISGAALMANRKKNTDNGKKNVDKRFTKRMTPMPVAKIPMDTFLTFMSQPKAVMEYLKYRGSK
jgi:hypothetical protein